MPKHTDTYARAYEACGAVFTELARFPTIDLIRERIGVNSPTVIKRAITDWTVAFAEQSREKQLRPGLPGALLDAADRLWALALHEARAPFDTEQQTWAAEKAALEDRLAAVEREREALAEAFEAHRTATTAALEKQTEAITQFHQQLEDRRADLASAEQALAEARAERAVLGATLETERAQFAERHQEWEARLEGEHRWHLQRIEQEKSRLEAQRQRELAQRDQELSRLTLEREQLKTRLRIVQEQQAEGRGWLAALEEQMKIARETLVQREQALTEAHHRVAELRAHLKAAETALETDRKQAEPKAQAREPLRKPSKKGHGRTGEE